MSRPEAEREAILDLLQQGGMLGAAFARRHDISRLTFSHWRNQWREQGAPAAIRVTVV